MRPTDGTYPASYGLVPLRALILALAPRGRIAGPGLVRGVVAGTLGLVGLLDRRVDARAGVTFGRKLALVDRLRTFVVAHQPFFRSTARSSCCLFMLERPSMFRCLASLY